MALISFHYLGRNHRIWIYGVGQEEGLPEGGWEGTDVGALRDSFNWNPSPKMPYGALQHDIIM